MRILKSSAICFCFMGEYECYQIQGNSMLPDLQEGDKVLVKSCEFYQVGDIVVARHPFRKTHIIKRITSISADGKYFLSGDNPAASTDSRTLGEITKKEIVGKVWGLAD